MKFTPASKVWLGLAGFCYVIAVFAFVTGTVPEQTRRLSWLSPGPLGDVFGDYAIIANWAIFGTACVGGAVFQMLKAKD